MAATRLIALHINKGKTFSQSLKDRMDYINNDTKTENGEYISCYECDPQIVEEQFQLTRALYEKRTGRKHKDDVIAYQIRQSFKPGEITAEEANQVGYETTMRFLKGKNAFIVATHTDKNHIHNHIIFNSVNIDSKKKYRDRLKSGKALARLSDIICLEHGLSVIEPGKYQGRENKPQHLTHSFREDIRNIIDTVLEMKPKDIDEFMKLLREQGYEVKQGKYISLKGKEQKGFIRLRSLGNGYREDDIVKRISGEMSVGKDYIKFGYEKKVDLLVDIQKKLAEGKAGGYERWAKVYNIKQMAKTIMFLQEHDIRDYDKLVAITSDKTEFFNDRLSEIKNCEKRMKEIATLKKHITNYAKTREIFMGYRNSGYSKKYLEEHRTEIEIHKEARKAFADYSGFIPKTAVLNMEYLDLADRKKKAYEEYQQAKKDMKEFQIAKSNVDAFLRNEEKKDVLRGKENEI